MVRIAPQMEVCRAAVRQIAVACPCALGGLDVASPAVRCTRLTMEIPYAEFFPTRCAAVRIAVIAAAVTIFSPPIIQHHRAKNCHAKPSVVQKCFEAIFALAMLYEGEVINGDARCDRQPDVV